MAEENKMVSNHTRKRTKNGQVKGKASTKKKTVTKKQVSKKVEIKKVEPKKVETKKEEVKTVVKKTPVKTKEIVQPVSLEETKKIDIEMPFIDKPKKRGHKVLKTFLLILFFLVLLFIVYAYGEPFDVSSDIDMSNRVNDKVNIIFQLKGNKPIMKTYYAIDPENENDKSLYKEIKNTGILFDKEIELEEVEITSGKKRICVYVESVLFTRDAECQLIVNK